MALRRTRASTDGSCATSWSSHEGSRGRDRPGFPGRVSESCHCLSLLLCFLLRAMEPRARRWNRTGFPAVEGQGGKGSPRNAGRHRRTPSGARRFRFLRGSSPRPLSARVLPGQVPGHGGAFRGIDGAGERADYGLVRRCGGWAFWISGSDLERAAGSGPAGSTGGSTRRQRTTIWGECSGECRAEAISIAESCFGGTVFVRADPVRADPVEPDCVGAISVYTVSFRAISSRAGSFKSNSKDAGFGGTVDFSADAQASGNWQRTFFGSGAGSGRAREGRRPGRTEETWRRGYQRPAS